LAEKLNAPVATTVERQRVNRRALRALRRGGWIQRRHAATRAVVDQADVIVFVGCRAGSVTTERWRHPAPGRARIIHIDVDPTVPGTNYKVDVPIVADAKLALSALEEAGGGARRRSFVRPTRRSARNSRHSKPWPGRTMCRSNPNGSFRL